MRTWRTLLGERLELYSPIGLRLIDAFTGAAPIGQIRPFLDVSDGSGGWRPTEIKAVRTPSHVLIYPGLERRAEVIGQPPRRYRVQIEAEGYRPFYRMTLEGRRFNGPPFYRETATGIEFDAFPYNDMTPPQFTITESFEITERSLEELRKRLEEEKVPVKVAKIRTALSAASDTAELDDVTKLEKDDIVSINSTEYTIQSVTKDAPANSGKITVTPQLPAGTAANTDVKKLSISTKDVDQLLEMLSRLP
jgi:hypothetical protein